MPTRNDRATIISMAVIASAAATLLHEGLGHGVTAYLRGDIPTELTSNHLSSLHPDRLVDAAGTLVNLAVGTLALVLSGTASARPNTRYFLWLLGALNLLPGAGYFLFSGLLGFGDWNEVIRDLPHHAALRVTMTLFGAALYFLVVRLLAITLRPFLPDRQTYNTVGRLPYYAAGLFSCLAGAFDPLGLKLLLISTIPAAFGGSSGLMWADSLVSTPLLQTPLTVHRQPAWWIAAAILGTLYVVFLGRGIQIHH